MAGNGTEKYEWLRALWASTLVACILATGCSTAKSTPMCSTAKSLLRFESPNAPLTLENKSYFSTGGFIEVFTRKEMFGAIDSNRTCTAYVEFSDSPLESETVVNSEALSMNVYTASHCLDLSKDHSLKLHIFDTEQSVYYPVLVNYAALDKIQTLRRAMKQKKLSSEAQAQILNSFRTNVPNLEGLFNQPTTTAGSVGEGISTSAGTACLKKDDPNYQNVCATYHDLIVVKIEPNPATPLPVLERLKSIRRSSTALLKERINQSKLASKYQSNPTFSVAFTDDKSNKLDLSGLHKSVRQRVQSYSKFKMVKFVADDLAQTISGCATNPSLPVCGVLPELSQVIQATLKGTPYEQFDPSGLSSIVSLLKTEFTASQIRMSALFSAFDGLIVTNASGVQSLPLDGRLYSNFRFVNDKAPVEDRPDPADPSRAFMNLHVNNLTGDGSGGRVFYITWNEQKLGRFSQLQIPRNFTSDVKLLSGNTIRMVGHLQAGDSGSIMMIEHLPFFAITSVDGQSTSGGATIRPLPEPIEEESESLNSAGAQGPKTSKLCK